jgi:ribonuclease III
MEDDRIIELTLLQESLSYKFKDLDLLNKALTHKSYSNETLLKVKNNERLEFLGDSVLDLIVGDYMFLSYKDLSEGPLSKIRAEVVNENCLAGLAQSIKLGSYLLLGKGEEFSGGRQKISILANAYEATIGALYCDSDFKTTANVFLPELIKKIDSYKDACMSTDFKSDLQEYTQSRFSCIPLYIIMGESGPGHDKQFNVKVTVRNKFYGSGKGRSKKEAEQKAAREALSNFLSNNI